MRLTDPIPKTTLQQQPGSASSSHAPVVSFAPPAIGEFDDKSWAWCPDGHGKQAPSSSFHFSFDKVLPGRELSRELVGATLTPSPRRQHLCHWRGSQHH